MVDYVHSFLIEKKISDDYEMEVAVTFFVSYDKDKINHMKDIINREMEAYEALMGISREEVDDNEFNQHLTKAYPELFKYYRDKLSGLTGMQLRKRFANDSEGIFAIHTEDVEMSREEVEAFIQMKKKEGKLKEFLKKAKV